MALKQPTPDEPFTLTTFEDDEVTRLLDMLVSELTCRADVDAYGNELANSRLINGLADDIRDHLQQAVLTYRTATFVVDGFAERRGVRA